MPERTEQCTCGAGVWGTCDYCGAEAWVNHRCPFPCDDVTCENVLVCVGCLTGRPCPMHNGDWDDDGWGDDEYDPAEDYAPTVTVQPAPDQTAKYAGAAARPAERGQDFPMPNKTDPLDAAYRRMLAETMRPCRELPADQRRAKRAADRAQQRALEEHAADVEAGRGLLLPFPTDQAV